MELGLYGPPGIGKSTLVKELRKRGLFAFDLEEFWSKQATIKEITHVISILPDSHCVLGTAGVDPTKVVPWKKVLLWLPQDEYEQRRRERDIKVPGKGVQQAHIMEDWMNLTRWDYKIKADAIALNQLFRLARSI
jgi:hypothetical protein